MKELKHNRGTEEQHFTGSIYLNLCGRECKVFNVLIASLGFESQQDSFDHVTLIRLKAIFMPVKKFGSKWKSRCFSAVIAILQMWNECIFFVQFYY